MTPDVTAPPLPNGSIPQKEADALRARINTLKDELKSEALKQQVLESRVAAGSERRKDAMITLVALLRCEDDPMTDSEWQARMDTVVKHARRIVSAERAAILAGKST